MSFFYRPAGLTYLQYLNQCTTAARAVVKEAVKKNYAPGELYNHVKVHPSGEKTVISSTVAQIHDIDLTRPR